MMSVKTTGLVNHKCERRDINSRSEACCLFEDLCLLHAVVSYLVQFINRRTNLLIDWCRNQGMLHTWPLFLVRNGEVFIVWACWSLLVTEFWHRRYSWNTCRRMSKENPQMLKKVKVFWTKDHANESIAFSYSARVRVNLGYFAILSKIYLEFFNLYLMKSEHYWLIRFITLTFRSISWIRDLRLSYYWYRF